MQANEHRAGLRGLVALPATPPVAGISLRVRRMVFLICCSTGLISALSQATEPLTPRSKVEGKFIKSFAYAGPTTSVHVESDLQPGSRIFSDREYKFAELPGGLKGADHVLTSNSDKYFNLAGLIEITVRAGTVVSVAHDDRLPRPDWLTRQFKPAEASVFVEGKPLRLFQRIVVAEEHLTLGANTEITNGKPCFMYLVFVNAAGVK